MLTLVTQFAQNIAASIGVGTVQTAHDPAVAADTTTTTADVGHNGHAQRTVADPIQFPVRTARSSTHDTATRLQAQGGGTAAVQAPSRTFRGSATHAIDFNKPITEPGGFSPLTRVYDKMVDAVSRGDPVPWYEICQGAVDHTDPNRPRPQIRLNYKDGRIVTYNGGPISCPENICEISVFNYGRGMAPEYVVSMANNKDGIVHPQGQNGQGLTTALLWFHLAGTEVGTKVSILSNYVPPGAKGPGFMWSGNTGLNYGTTGEFPRLSLTGRWTKDPKYPVRDTESDTDPSHMRRLFTTVVTIENPTLEMVTLLEALPNYYLHANGNIEGAMLVDPNPNAPTPPLDIKINGGRVRCLEGIVSNTNAPTFATERVETDFGELTLRVPMERNGRAWVDWLRLGPGAEAKDRWFLFPWFFENVYGPGLETLAVRRDPESTTYRGRVDRLVTVALSRCADRRIMETLLDTAVWFGLQERFLGGDTDELPNELLCSQIVVSGQNVNLADVTAALISNIWHTKFRNAYYTHSREIYREFRRFYPKEPIYLLPRTTCSLLDQAQINRKASRKVSASETRDAAIWLGKTLGTSVVLIGGTVYCALIGVHYVLEDLDLGELLSDQMVHILQPDQPPVAMPIFSPREALSFQYPEYTSAQAFGGRGTIRTGGTQPGHSYKVISSSGTSSTSRAPNKLPRTQVTGRPVFSSIAPGGRFPVNGYWTTTTHNELTLGPDNHLTWMAMDQGYEPYTDFVNGMPGQYTYFTRIDSTDRGNHNQVNVTLREGGYRITGVRARNGATVEILRHKQTGDFAIVGDDYDELTIYTARETTQQGNPQFSQPEPPDSEEFINIELLNGRWKSLLWRIRYNRDLTNTQKMAVLAYEWGDRGRYEDRSSLDAQTFGYNREYATAKIMNTMAGNCAIFATGMAISGRAVHVPTRYKGGDLIHWDDTMGTHADNTYWDEQHKRWVPFEPNITSFVSDLKAGLVDDAYIKWLRGILKENPDDLWASTSLMVYDHRALIHQLQQLKDIPVVIPPVGSEVPNDEFRTEVAKQAQIAEDAMSARTKRSLYSFLFGGGFVWFIGAFVRTIRRKRKREESEGSD